MPKFQLESKYLLTPTLPQKKKDFNGAIKIHDSAWAWLTQIRSRTGIPVSQIVDAMVAFCDEHLEIVPVGGKTAMQTDLQTRSTEDIMQQLNALLLELNLRVVSCEEE